MQEEVFPLEIQFGNQGKASMVHLPLKHWKLAKVKNMIEVKCTNPSRSIKPCQALN